jgi:hypothetical protein
MLDKLKADFDGILELVQKVPDPLKETALKIILDQWFAANAAPPQPPSPQPTPPLPAGGGAGTPMAPTFKAYMVANALSEAELEKVMHPLGPNAQLAVSEIPGAGKATKQVNLALLLSVKQALIGGTFGCALKELRETCLHYDCYDSANFAANLKKNKTLFKPWQKGDDLELSGSGMKKAAGVVKTLASES